MTTAETRQRQRAGTGVPDCLPDTPARTWTTSQCDGNDRTPNRQICFARPSPKANASKALRFGLPNNQMT